MGPEEILTPKKCGSETDLDKKKFKFTKKNGVQTNVGSYKAYKVLLKFDPSLVLDKRATILSRSDWLTSN